MCTIIDSSSSIPLYVQIRNLIVSDIENGTVKKGEKLPSEPELAQKYGVSRITIRKALECLEKDELLERIQGKGTFVNTPKTKFNANDNIGFTRSWELAGRKPSTELIKMELVVPPKSIREYLEVEPDEPVVSSFRRRFVDDQPISLEINYYSKKLNYIISEDLSGSLYDILINKHHLTINHHARILSLVKATAKEAGLLGVSKNSPLLLFKDRLFDENGAPLFYSLQTYNIGCGELFLY